MCAFEGVFIGLTKFYVDVLSFLIQTPASKHLRINGHKVLQ